MRRTALAIATLLAIAGTARADDYVIRDGNGFLATIRALACQSTKLCPAHVTIDSSGNEKGISGNPLTIGEQKAEVCVTPTITSGSAYSAGNVVGGLLSFANLVRSATGTLMSVRLTFKSTQTAEFDVTFFSGNPSASTWTDKTAPAIAAADKLLVQPPLKLTNNFSGLGTHTVYGSDAIGRALNFGGTTGYAVITTPGTPTFTSTTDLQLCADVKSD